MYNSLNTSQVEQVNPVRQVQVNQSLKKGFSAKGPYEAPKV